MSNIPDQLVEAIHTSGYQACIILTGGGVGAVHALLSRPGASRFVLDVHIPYGHKATDDLLGDVPISYCSEETAKKMAQKACAHAALHTPRALGIACTAALRTTYTREDADRAYIYILSKDRTMCHEVRLKEGTRADQDDVVSNALLSLIARFVAE